MISKKIIGFTGTQAGMTDKQFHCVSALLCSANYTMAHHGGCEGADTQFHAMCQVLGIPVTIHPGDKKQAAVFQNKGIVCETKSYLTRNHDIVKACTVLIATPKTNKEILRSGTWSTIRYAKKIGRKVIIV